MNNIIVLFLLLRVIFAVGDMNCSQPWEVTAAATDNYALPNATGGYAFQFITDNDIQSFMFVDKGNFDENLNLNTATLLGSVVEIGNRSNEYSLQLILVGTHGQPNLGLKVNAYSGPVEDISSWRYYDVDITQSNVIGMVENAGTLIMLTFRSTVQVGIGANNKNVHFGASGQFSFNTTSTSTVSKAGNITMNLDLTCLGEITSGPQSSTAAPLDSGWRLLPTVLLILFLGLL